MDAMPAPWLFINCGQLKSILLRTGLEVNQHQNLNDSSYRKE